MTQPKSESILELVERLDETYGCRDRNWSERCEIDRQWPRLWDALREMREFVEDIEDHAHTAWKRKARALLARLDNLKKP